MPANRTTKFWLGLAAVIQALTLLGFLATGPGAAPVQAQGIPDSGAQLAQVIEQLKATNAKVDRLITLLAEGKLEVGLRKSDDAGRKQ